MPATLARNSTIGRAINIAPWRLARAYFRVASRFVPSLAQRHAERLFTAPPRYAGRKPLVDGRRETVLSGRHSLAVWQVGAASAPAVLLAHGWGGRGVQMASFVAPLLAAGYRVVWFDQPGHGESGSGPVALPDFVRAAEALAATHGPFTAAIGHSLGAAALGVALRRGMHLERVVLVSPPSSLGEYARNFARVLGIAPSIRDAMRGALERRYGVRFEEIDRIDELAQVEVPSLFVHDSRDREVPIAHSLRLASRMPRAALVTTHELGHYRILREPAVVASIVDFVGGRDDLPAEIPSLPRPAPLY
jgi:pimeloyl-ACP methyl ester carboxylesterase